MDLIEELTLSKQFLTAGSTLVPLNTALSTIAFGIYQKQLQSKFRSTGN